LLALALMSLLSVPAAAGADAGVIAGRVRASPLVVTLELSSASAITGRSAQASATVTNIAGATIRSIVVALRADSTDVRIGKGSIAISQLKGGKSATVSWTVCGRTPGTYVLLARVTADTWSVDSDARILTILPGGKKACA
jgi:hypothetical protein